MAEEPDSTKPGDGENSKLELPKLSLRRGRKQGDAAEETPAETLAVAREAAGDLDVRLGGGASVVRDFVAAGLVDHLHLVVVPIVLGRGARLWEGLEALEDTFDIESVSSPSGVTHLTFTKRR